jgi:tetratricopeptide (TPR) repeat protein
MAESLQGRPECMTAVGATIDGDGFTPVKQSWDLFFSYRRQDLDRARALLDALYHAGVRVWRDETDIPEQESITSKIRDGIASSKAFLAFYSRSYPESHACQQEIIIAWLAAQQIDLTATGRVWIVNPDSGFEHIPVLMRDNRIPLITDDESQVTAVTQELAHRLNTMGSVLLSAGIRHQPAYQGVSPIQASRFVGRTMEMWDLHAKLTADRISIISGVYGQAAAQLRGLGGNGKSLLAREYIIRFGSAYPGGVFWINAFGNDDSKGVVGAEQRETLRQDQIREFSVRVGVPVNGLTASEIETLFWRSIESANERCLWVVDDLPSGLTLDTLQRTWNARWRGASTLVTTRSKEYGAIGSSLDLGVFSTEEALRLLCLHREPADDAERVAAHRILDLLGNHPLAVEVAGSYLAVGVDDFQSYVVALEDPNTDAVEFGNAIEESLPTGHERSISATLLKSIRHLKEEGSDFLRVAAVLAVAPISVALVSEVFDRLDGTGKTRSLKGVNQAEVLSLCESLSDGVRAVHTLVSRTVRFRFPADERSLKIRSAVVQVLSERLENIRHVGEHSKITLDMPHARHLIAKGLYTVEETVLAHWVALRDYERADYAPARRLEEEVLRASISLLGQEHPYTLRAMNTIAEILRGQGDLVGTRKLQEQLMTARRRLFGEDHPDTLTAINNFAATLTAQGDPGSARSLLEQVVASKCRLWGKEHPDTLTSMNNLAEAFYALGLFPESRALLEEALSISRRVLGEKHPDTTRAKSNLGLTLHAQGEFLESRALLEAAAKETLDLMGESHPYARTAMNNLALTLYALNDLKGAREILDRIILLSRRYLGDEHPDTLRATVNLAGIHYAEGDLIKAQQLQEEMLEASQRILGPKHTYTLAVMNNLAQTLKVRGKLGHARELQGKVLETSRQVLGGAHPTTLTAMNNLAQTLAVMGKLSEARELLEPVVPARRRLLGDKHAETLSAMGNLAQIHYALGNFGDARALQVPLLAALREVMGDEHTETLAAMDGLARTLYRDGDLPGARRLQEEALRRIRKQRGEEHVDTLTVMNNLAATLFAQRYLAAARKLQEHVLLARRRLLGDKHADTRTAMSNLAKTLNAQGNRARARKMEQEARGSR